MTPLGLLARGEVAEVMDAALQNDAGRKRSGFRVEDMGLRAGKSIMMLNNEGRGPLLMKVDGSRIAMARGMAMKIMVRRKD